MSNINPPGYSPNSKAKLKLDLPMHSIIATLIATQKGWAIRQTMKWATIGGTSLTTWLVAHGVAITDGSALTAAAVTLASGVVELLLSKAASHIAAK
jgi:hypothetical protein